MQKINKRLNKRHRVRWAIIIIISLFLGLCAGGYISLIHDLPPTESISFFMAPVSSLVYDDNDNLISEFFIERRELAKIDRVPAYLKDGVICIEDKTFYKHWGVDVLALVRAFITNIIHMRVMQGGSTITMQLARNMFLTLEQTMDRKLKEMALAIRIERAYTKDEILERYLNQINFGQGRYGVATAARYYFDKDITELTLNECALLIALPKSPENYSPYKHLDIAKQRRDLVLKVMFENNLISGSQYEEAVAETIIVVEHKPQKRFGEYYVEEIRRYLELKYGPEFLYRSGAHIYTTLNTDIQKAAEEIMEKHLIQIEKDYHFKETKAKYDSIGIPDTLRYSPYLQGAIAVMDYHTGEVKALVGGRDFAQSKWNRATQATRQAGSAFKVFVFTAAIDNGFTPSDVVLDLPIVLEVPGMDSIYRPSNYDRKFMGPITIKQALKHSRNLAAIRLIRNIGPELVVHYAHNLGVNSPLLAVVSLALGSCDVSLIEMVGAVGTIANLGERLETTYIRKITDRDGTIIEMNTPIPENILSPQVSYIMTNMMSSVVDGGTAYYIRRYYTGPAAGKTGTTNNYSDAWFIGYTPKYICGVWVGNDNNDRIFRGATGGNVSSPIWGDLMKVIDKPPHGVFPKPNGLVDRKVCSQTGLLARQFCPNVSEEVFIAGTEPQDSCDVHSFEGGFDYQDDFNKINDLDIDNY